MDTMYGGGDVPRVMLHAYRITIAFLALAWVFILLRVWTRTFVIANFGWDDSIMVLAGLIFTVYCATVLFIATHGGGTVISDFEHLKWLMKLANVAESSYVLAMMFIKISIAIFFARIIAKRQHMIIIYVAIAITVVSSVSTYLYCFLRCGPDLDEYLVRQLTDDCAPVHLDLFMAYQQAAFNTLTDVIFVAMPVVVLWNASMDRRAKVSAGFVLIIATLGAICSMIRFKYVEGVLKIGDFFWHAVNISMWSTIEAGTCIIAACTATLRPLLKSTLDRVQTATSPSSSGTPPPSSSAKSDQQSKHQSLQTIRVPNDDLEYGNIEATESSCALTKPPEYTFVELITMPDSAHLAPESGIDNRPARPDSILG
ncbi:hypothetical protein yc1106_02066 [Curvularia clavata]|uniref:Rhodopsin domain-containing protein n=1 Tax=Curvularia clavata TaxID=95742 RepID=A0A9Q8Z303_CURCL|nr:hypothetical protein yc1106_02066 [Curvularia clavata]